MEALTKEILDSLADFNRRFKVLETQINRLERYAFTPAENMRFYLEMANTLSEHAVLFTKDTMDKLVERVEEEEAAKRRRGELVYLCPVHGEQQHGRLGFGAWHGITEAPDTTICGHGEPGAGCSAVSTFVRVEK